MIGATATPLLLRLDAGTQQNLDPNALEDLDSRRYGRGRSFLGICCQSIPLTDSSTT
jgi:hypothetical protein